VTRAFVRSRAASVNKGIASDDRSRATMIAVMFESRIPQLFGVGAFLFMVEYFEGGFMLHAPIVVTRTALLYT
jgi:hypothetical protein